MINPSNPYAHTASESEPVVTIPAAVGNAAVVVTAILVMLQLPIVSMVAALYLLAIIVKRVELKG